MSQVTSEEQALAEIDALRREFHDARHHCWAWRLGPAGDAWRSSDDGEPSGSAGRPILQQLEGLELSETLCVVIRYFGGTKLGVGGLARAYGQAAQEALERATIELVVRKRRIVATHPFEVSNAIAALLAQHQVQPIESEYGTEVRLVFEIPIDEADAFERALVDATRGRIVIEG